MAYKAAVDLADAKNLPRGREDFHTLSWLQYAYLQEGKFDEAQKCVDQAKAVADKDTAPNIRDGYAAMKARQVVETARWEKLALPTGAVKDGGAPGYDGSAAYLARRRPERREARRPRHRQRRARQAEGDADAGGDRLERLPREAVRDHGEGSRRRRSRRRRKTRRPPSGC